jgi:hypothetical protein
MIYEGGKMNAWWCQRSWNIRIGNNFNAASETIVQNAEEMPWMWSFIPPSYYSNASSKQTTKINSMISKYASKVQHMQRTCDVLQINYYFTWYHIIVKKLCSTAVMYQWSNSVVVVVVMWRWEGGDFWKQPDTQWLEMPGTTFQTEQTAMVQFSLQTHYRAQVAISIVQCPDFKKLQYYLHLLNALSITS